MIDISLNSITASTFFFCFAIFVITSIVGFRSIHDQHPTSDKHNSGFLFKALFFIVLLTAFNDTDYFGYKDIYGWSY